MSDQVFVYIGVKSCGCVPFITVDRPEFAKDVAKSIAKLIRDGYTVERLPIEEGKSRLKFCSCNKPVAQQPNLLEAA